MKQAILKLFLPMSLFCVRPWRVLTTALVLLLLISLPVTTVNARAATKSSAPTTADDAFLAVRDAVRAGRLDRAADAAALMARLEPTHPLLPYAEYWQISAQLKARPVAIDDASVLGFIQRNHGSLVADLARRDWLLALGKRGDFAAFDTVYPAFVLNDDAQVTCYALLSRYRAATISLAPVPELENLLKNIRTVLSNPRNIEGEGCSALGNALNIDGRLKPEEIWTWARLAADANLNSAVRRYVDFLSDVPSPNAPPQTAVLTVILDKPLSWLQKFSGEPTYTARELVLMAFSEVARSDPEQAARMLEELPWSNRLKQEDRDYIWAQIGAAAARKQLLQASEWSRKSLAVPGLSEEILSWHVRAALRAQDWSLVHAFIEKMPIEMRRNNDGAWIYWLGRALKKEGKLEEARAQWRLLAGQTNFYAQLATEELGLPVTIPPRALPVTETELAEARDRPGFTRALRFYQIDLRSNGNVEWNFTVRSLNDRQLLAAAEWAQQNSILDRVVSTADRTRTEHNFSLRYLMPFKAALADKVDKAGLDIEWVYGLIRQESRFVTAARSSVGASGLMQVMPGTAKYVARKIGMSDYRANAIQSMETNLTLGTQYLRMILDNLDKLPVLATAGYNAGPGRPRAWRSSLIKPVEGAIFAETIPFNETRDYVKKVMSNAVYYGLLDGKPQSLKTRLGLVVPSAGSYLDTACIPTGNDDANGTNGTARPEVC